MPSRDSVRKKRVAGGRVFPEPVQASWKMFALEGKAVYPGHPWSYLSTCRVLFLYHPILNGRTDRVS